MIREELLHPAVSHFPLALLVLLFFTKLAYLIVTEKYENLKKNLHLISKFLLMTGAAFLLPSLFLGDMALDIVKNEACDLISVYRHEDMAHNTLITFIIAIVLDTLTNIEQIPRKFYGTINILLIITIGVGNYFLLKTAHMGGNLVYEQGLAVKAVKKSCH